MTWFVCVIAEGGSGSMEQKTAVAPGTGFTGLTPPRLGVEVQAVCPQGVSLGVQVDSNFFAICV